MADWRIFYNEAAPGADPEWIEGDRPWSSKATKPASLLKLLEPYHEHHFIYGKKTIEGPDADGAYITRDWKGEISKKIVPIDPEPARVTRQITFDPDTDAALLVAAAALGWTPARYVEHALQSHLKMSG